MRRTSPKSIRDASRRAYALLPFEDKALHVLTLFRQIVATAKRHFQSVQKKCGITGAQLWALWQISVNPGLKVGDLARHMSIHQSTASNLVEHLRGLGLIHRERARSDQRVVRLFASDAGRALLRDAPHPMRGVLAEAVWQLSERELLALHGALGLLARRIDSIDKESAKRPLSDLI